MGCRSLRSTLKAWMSNTDWLVGMDFSYSYESETGLSEAVKYSIISCMGEVAEANKLTTNSGYIISQFVPMT